MGMVSSWTQSRQKQWTASLGTYIARAGSMIFQEPPNSFVGVCCRAALLSLIVVQIECVCGRFGPCGLTLITCPLRISPVCKCAQHFLGKYCCDVAQVTSCART